MLWECKAAKVRGKKERKKKRRRLEAVMCLLSEAHRLLLPTPALQQEASAP